MLKISPPYRIIVADGDIHDAGWKILKAAQDIDILGPFDCHDDLQTALKEADALLICTNTNVDKKLLEKAHSLKIIARAGARLDNVDIEEATRRGILVIHVPDANVTAMVEYTFYLVLSLARNQSRYSPINGQFGFQLSGKTLGIIGFGRQGHEVASRAQAFGLHVLAYDPYIDLSFARERAVEIVNLPELLARADIVTMHTAYTQQTHHMINAETISQMKPGAHLINCVHPGLVDQTALLEALENVRISGAALITLDQQGFPVSPDLIQHSRVLNFDQTRLQTLEAQVDTSSGIVRDLLAALRDQDYRNIVNLPFNDRTPYQTMKPYIDLAVKLGKLQGQMAGGWIQRVEVELLGEGLRELVRPVAAVLLSGMIRPIDERPVNWVSAPVMAYAQGIITAQIKELVVRGDHPALIACRVHWESGYRTVAGALFGNGEVRLVQYNDFEVDAYPDGFVLILENTDLPGVIGKVGTRLGRVGINIAQWRYGRDFPNGRGVSFINLDDRVPASILTELESEEEIQRARLVKL